MIIGGFQLLSISLGVLSRLQLALSTGSGFHCNIEYFLARGAVLVDHFQ